MTQENDNGKTEDNDNEDDVYKRLNAFRPPDKVLKKHPCKDCFNCLFCSDARCAVCLKSKCCQNNCSVQLKK